MLPIALDVLQIQDPTFPHTKPLSRLDDFFVDLEKKPGSELKTPEKSTEKLQISCWNTPLNDDMKIALFCATIFEWNKPQKCRGLIYDHHVNSQ